MPSLCNISCKRFNEVVNTFVARLIKLRRGKPANFTACRIFSAVMKILYFALPLSSLCSLSSLIASALMQWKRVELSASTAFSNCISSCFVLLLCWVGSLATGKTSFATNNGTWSSQNNLLRVLQWTGSKVVCSMRGTVIGNSPGTWRVTVRTVGFDWDNSVWRSRLTVGISSEVASFFSLNPPLRLTVTKLVRIYFEGISWHQGHTLSVGGVKTNEIKQSVQRICSWQFNVQYLSCVDGCPISALHILHVFSDCIGRYAQKKTSSSLAKRMVFTSNEM